MDINEIIEEGEERGQKEPESLKPKRKNKINKKLLIVPIVLILGTAAYFYLHKSTPAIPSVITGPAGKAVFPPAVPEQFINKSRAVSKPAVVNNAPVNGNTSAPNVPLKGTKQNVTKKAVNNTLNDLFTVKYKHKAKKTNMPGVPNIPPNANVPAIPFNQNLPNFNLKNMAAKIKNMQGMPAENSFNVSGYSGGYVIVECGKSTKYLKAGQSACGYTLLKANSNDATFSHNGKFKKISY